MPVFLDLPDELLRKIANASVKKDASWADKVKEELPFRLVHPRITPLFTAAMLSECKITCAEEGSKEGEAFVRFCKGANVMGQVSYLRFTQIATPPKESSSNDDFQSEERDHEKWQDLLKDRIQQVLACCSGIQTLDMWVYDMPFEIQNLTKLENLVTLRLYGTAARAYVVPLLKASPRLDRLELRGADHEEEKEARTYFGIVDGHLLEACRTIRYLHIDSAEMPFFREFLAYYRFQPMELEITLQPHFYKQTRVKNSYRQAIDALAEIVTRPTFSHRLSRFTIASAKMVEPEEMEHFSSSLDKRWKSLGKEVQIDLPDMENLKDTKGAWQDMQDIMNLG